MAKYKETVLTANESAQPETLCFTAGLASINITASGPGLTTGSGPIRWYNSNALSNPVSTLLPIVLPFETLGLPTNLYDATCLIEYDGRRLIYATSNSPDNTASANTVQETNKELYWLDLVCYGGLNAIGSNTLAADYVAFAKPVSLTGNDETKLHFLNATPTTESFTIVTERFGNNTSVSTTRVVSIPAGTTNFVINPAGYLSGAPFNSLLPYAGYFRTSVTTTNPNYKSVLPYYHYGAYSSIALQMSNTTYAVLPAFTFNGSSTTYAVSPIVAFNGSNTTYAVSPIVALNGSNTTYSEPQASTVQQFTYSWFDPNASSTKTFVGTSYSIGPYGPCIGGQAINVFNGSVLLSFSCIQVGSLVITPYP